MEHVEATTTEPTTGNGEAIRGELEAALIAEREDRVKRAMTLIGEALEAEDCALQGQPMFTEDGRIACRIAVVPR